MSERKAGWYWVKITPRLSSNDDEWELMKVESGRWFMAGVAEALPEGIIHTVSPARIPTPDEPWQCVPVEATDEMVEAGAQRLVSWACDGLVWPDSWDALDVAAARNDAERVIRSALSDAPKPEDAE